MKTHKMVTEIPMLHLASIDLLVAIDGPVHDIVIDGVLVRGARVTAYTHELHAGIYPAVHLDLYGPNGTRNRIVLNPKRFHFVKTLTEALAVH
jgi:hypothetical protein